MISHLTGTLFSKSTDHCVIDVGGVGYLSLISLTSFSSLPEAGAKVSLNIHTYVREDQITLYGFATLEEKALFLKLIGVSGVGPKTALAILSGIPADHLVDAIEAEDKVRLSSITGVGKKTAERIIVELKDRLAKDLSAKFGMTVTPRSRSFEDAISALTNLGYQRMQAEGALKKCGWSEKMAIEEAVKGALKELCRV